MRLVVDKPDYLPQGDYCDNCYWLDPKEHEQTDKKESHWCRLFKQTLKHYCIHPKLARLFECLIMDKVINSVECLNEPVIPNEQLEHLADQFIMLQLHWKTGMTFEQFLNVAMTPVYSTRPHMQIFGKPMKNGKNICW